MIIVSNSSPLINLAWVGKLGILQQLYTQIIIPQSVWNEIVVEGKGQPGSEEVKNSQWIQIQSASNHDLIQSLRQELDFGEAEAIALAIEKQAELLLMDERIGRETAIYFGIRAIGVIGILVEAKHKGLISEIRPILDLLQSVAGFYIKPALYNRIVNEQGEAL